MNIDFEEDLQNKIIKLKVKIKRRKRINEPRVVFKWADVKKVMSEQYTPPQGYTLGKCSDSHKMLDNTEDLACEGSWRFELLPKAKATVRKSATTAKTTVKTTTKKTSTRKK